MKSNLHKTDRIFYFKCHCLLVMNAVCTEIPNCCVRAGHKDVGFRVRGGNEDDAQMGYWGSKYLGATQRGYSSTLALHRRFHSTHTHA